MAESQANDNTTCVVCFKNVLYFSIGECDHPVCFECSTRMRVLCLQNECPICRHDLSRVVFTESIQPYKELRNKVFTDQMFERQFKIGFCSQEIKKAYDVLLENRCKICDKIPPFRTFSMLSDHMRKVHERYFCDLCVKHLKIFTSERKCYTRQELAHHRRKGDLDDTSHRGHPLCEFCEERFMDADELYRHLRKEHLYCHLCDADGRNLYYASHSALAQHFRTDHYLCEEGECAGQHLTAVFRSEIDLKGLDSEKFLKHLCHCPPAGDTQGVDIRNNRLCEEGECAGQHLTAVFRSEIDLKAHKATVHGRGMPRGAARQARTLELQFNITPHPVVQRTPRDRDRDRGDRERERERLEEQSPPAPTQQHIDTGSDEQFPRLSAAPAAQSLVLGGPTRSYRGSDGLARTDKNFPTLGGGGGGPSRAPPPKQTPPQAVAATVVRNSKPSLSIQVHSQPASASNFRLTQTSGNRITIPPQQKRQPHTPLSDDDFPSLGRDDHPSIGAGTVQPPKVTLINSQEMSALSRGQSQQHQAKKPPLSTEAFPALSAAAAPSHPPQWITVSKTKDKARPVRQEPPPPPREPSFNPVADFPTLPVNTKAKTKKQPAPAPTTPATTTEAKPTKKEKKKQNNSERAKKENISELAYVNGVIDKKIVKELSYGAAVNEQKAESDRKIKTVESSSVTVNLERGKNGGTGDFALAARDYPPLNPRSDNCPPSKQPTNPPSKKMPNGSVPPGFSPRASEVTFTNSAGQKFPATPHSYIAPPNFEQRNRALVKKFAVALGGAAAVEDFKFSVTKYDVDNGHQSSANKGVMIFLTRIIVCPEHFLDKDMHVTSKDRRRLLKTASPSVVVASRAFRDSIISAEEFYQHCRSAMGDQLDLVFPELVALLPDIAKQQELVVGRDVAQQLHVCSTCGQLVSAGDRRAHETAHWPPLAAR